MKYLKLWATILFLCNMQTFFAQEKIDKRIPKKVYNTKRTEIAPQIDGQLNDEVWNSVSWDGNFTQWEPNEGSKPTQDTKFKILYDAKNLYVAVRCFDTDPSKIVSRLSRRDGFDGDWIEVNIDSYHDFRTGFSFTITAAGVKGDEAISANGSGWDRSWNPIWYAKTAIDDQGWTAEFKIPFTQLRFNDNEEQVWGLQLHRRDFRLEERSLWQRIPRDLPGWVSNFGELRGIKNIKPQKQIEIQPYVVTQMETFQEIPGNPFKTGKDSKLNLGLDGKIGVTNNLTVDFTINPDFGQVEADPSAIALDGFQIFQEEQRPFFVENKNIFDYRITNSQAGGPFGRDNLFYSRRIGRQPQGYTTAGPGEYVDTPKNSSILGAAKFSGKTKAGWSIGLLEAVTEEETAEIDKNGIRRFEVVEPLTNFFLTRLQKEFNESNTFIGGIFSATNRNLNNTQIDYLHTSAFTGGLDFKHQWNNRDWYVGGNVVLSKVSGSKTAILNTQLSHLRYFQRVDATHVSVDPNRTSLSGHGGNFQIGKTGGEKINFESGVTWRSPGLEMNDMGFQRNADDITHYTWIGYRILKPFSVFRTFRFNYNHWTSFNFEGKHTYLGFNINSRAEFKNNWKLSGGMHYAALDFSDAALRGGPMLRLPSSFNTFAKLDSDSRKKVQYGIEFNQTSGESNSFYNYNASLEVRYVPINSFNISVSPSYSYNNENLQYVQTLSYAGASKYLNASLQQDTFSMSIRLNYTIKPNLSIQYYGAPFISRGRYTNFKYITNAKAEQFENRFQKYNQNQLNFDVVNDRYLVDENTDSVTDYSFGNPNFSIVEFQSNLVARWEYIPGSEVFLVWSQGIRGAGNPMDKLLPSLNDVIFGQKAHNIFLIKATYRFMM